VTIDSATQAEICRMAKVDKMSINAISMQLKVHHSTVKNALQTISQAFPYERQFPPSLKAHEGLIESLMAKYHKLQSKSLTRLLRDRGIQCSTTTSLRALRHLRNKTPVVYGIRRVLSGQEAQMDWGEKVVAIGEQRIKIYFFVLILSYSRHLYAQATRDMKSATFLCCHTAAFLSFSGVPRKILYDNLKTAVTSRVGDHIQFSKEFYGYTAHYLYEPIACHVRTPQEKGRVERQVSSIKNNFLNGREFTSVENLNKQLQVWVKERMGDKHPEDRTRTINSFYDEEHPKLLPLPQSPLWPRQIAYAKIGKQPYARFEGNRYSLPPKVSHTQVRILAGMSDIEIYAQNKLVAIHPRSYKKDQIIDDKEHLEQLLSSKGRVTSASYRRSYILRLIPGLEDLFQDLANRQESLSPVMARLDLLVDQHGIQTLSEAVDSAIQDDSLRIDSLELLLSQKKFSQSERYHDPSVIRYSIPKHLREIRTQHNNLEKYSKGPSDDKI
jgi:transposase